jgi:uncharacterized protein YndB with AHSA1/START domain
MSERPKIHLTVNRKFEASAERVFDAWLDPDKARHFLFATPTGEMTRVEIDARVGGKFIIVERRDGVDADHFGEYLEIDRPRRLVFLFGDWHTGERDRVTIQIEPDGEGCRLTLTHEMNPDWADYEEQTREGWTGIVAGIESVL